MGKKVNSNSDNSDTSINQQPQTRYQKSLEMCGICYGSIEEQGKIDSCSHNFCFACIKRWSERENTCPFCKQRFFTINRQLKRVNYFEMQKVIAKSKNSKPIKVAQKDQRETQISQNRNQYHLNTILRIIQHYFNSSQTPSNLRENQSLFIEVQLNQGSQTNIIPVRIRRPSQHNEISVQQESSTVGNVAGGDVMPQQL